MKSKLIFCASLLMLVQVVASAATITVPSRTYHTIQDGIDAASNGDTVIVQPGVYTGPGNINLDFGVGPKKITVMSTVNPNDPCWGVIAATIIDCCGTQLYNPPAGDTGNANRAFWFHHGEGSDSQVIGFTIRNGYARGQKGSDGGSTGLAYTSVWHFIPYTTPGNTAPWQTFPNWRVALASNPPIDPCTLPPAALDGNTASGNGYGGAILCDNSSPTISYCVIENCTATGALGGSGATGQSGQWYYYTWADFNWNPGPGYQQLLPTATVKNTTNGQSGGNGGMGSGNGYGGAIAMTGLCNPEIDSCRFINNSAQGGQGGAGGPGGNAAWPPFYNSGLEGGGGNAGVSDGNGMGGAIYAVSGCLPTFNNCLFENNAAKTGPRSPAGGRGQGNVNITTINGVSTRVSSGLSSVVITSGNPTIAGGAVYFKGGGLYQPEFNDCNFINNKAYLAFSVDPLLTVAGYPTYLTGSNEDILGYTVGGAIYFGDGCIQGNPVINTCDFIKNGGGALYFSSNCVLSIGNTSAVNRGHPGRKNLFQGNIAPDDTIIDPTLGGYNGFGIYNVPSFGSGGAIYMNPTCTIDISNSIFNGNTAKENGGAIETQSNLTISDCAFSNNIVLGNGDFTGFGGAVDVYLGTDLAINANNCSFTGNKSVQGGALSTEIFHGSFNRCYFNDNMAQIGGALDLSLGTAKVTIAESNFSNNAATGGNGGGIDCFYTSADINSCQFFNNSTGGTFAYGGGIDIDGAKGTGHTVRNSLFVGNSSSYNGGAVACEGGSVAPLIQNCTFSQNIANQVGGSIYADWGATPTIRNGIIQKSNNYAIYKDNAGGSTSYCLFYNNLNGDYYSAGVIGIPGGSGNLTGDPLFVTGNLGDYYLSQTTAGQAANSPAVNSGTGTPLALGLSTKTTATNDAPDIGTVDMGYHFSRAVGMPQFHLDVNVVGGIGTISVLPAPLPDGNYYAGRVVTITATPQTGWVVKQWAGTDNDSEVTVTQTVVMNSNRVVTVEFKLPTYLNVPQGYPDIIDAMAEANDGDIIVVASGIYHSAQIQFTKSVEVRSEQPDNPDYVAQTVIDVNQNGPVAGPIIFFPRKANSGCVLNGFTIRNSNWSGFSGDNGTNPGENGGDGGVVEGGAIWIGPEAGPVIKNCVIRDNRLQAGSGANGANADLYHNAGRGGWGGWARGGAVYCSVNSYPQFINCQILNNSVFGGFGGNGGDYSATGGNSNYGGNYSRADWFDYDPRDLSADWVPGDLWEKWTELAPFIPLNATGKPHRGSDNYRYYDDYGNYHYGYIGDYRWYSGYGGGVYVNTSSNVTFTNCTISNNLAEGGFSGLGGNYPNDGVYRPGPWPSKYEIPAFGGGVYVAATSKVVFNGCVISNNTASNPTFDHTPIAGGLLPTNYDPLHHYHLDSYLGHGGGVCAEDTAKVTFVDCNFTGNNASLGGGLFGSNILLALSDCEFVSNRAYQGGGMFGQNGSISINGSTFNSNTSPDDANDPNVLGQGGGLNLLSANSNIADTNISGNSAEEIGGGVYLSGSNFTMMHNCLLTDNSAGQMGGAVAATTSAQVQVANCTIVNNIANMGGGLLSYDGSFVDVINSIFWGNRAGLGANGNQIAVSGIDSPAEIQVHYSDVQDANDPCAWTSDINTLDFVICFDTTGSMGGDITAVRSAARQIVNAIAAQYASYRLGLVDFRDYPDGNYGSPGDWPYLDRVKFTTDANQLINSLQAMAAGGGADTPEAIYTALMHCIDANALAARLTANGNARFIDVNSPGLGNWRQGEKVMRVILLLTDAPPHDPENYTNYVLNDIIMAASSNDSIHVIPVVIRGDPDAENALRPVAVGTGGVLISATDSNAVPGAVLNAIGLLSQIPTPIFIGPNSTINWNPGTINWSSGSNNINANPYFINGYFLSQIAAGQDVNSPCVDKGSADVNSPDINLGGYTTRTDSVPDAGIVDMGYHYSAFTPTQYYLNFIAGNGLGLGNILPASGYFDWYKTIPLQVTLPIPTGSQVLWTGTNNDNLIGATNSVTMTGNRTVTVAFVSNSCHLTLEVVGNHGGLVTVSSSSLPALPDGNYTRGTVVTLTATPDPGYRINSWQGTDNDGLFTQTNTVTMNGDKTVRVTFSLPQTVTVPGDFTTIQAAIQAARSGDIVIVSSGVYHGSSLILNKEITLASTNPDDPCVVAATIIDSSGFANPAMVFTTGATANTVVNGFTFTSGTYQRVPAQNATAAGQNGPDGGSIWGGAVWVGLPIEQGNLPASPTIKNCVIRDVNIRAGDAGNGGNADTTVVAGRGGWGGRATGGGVYVSPLSNPTFVNCTITNCIVTGGNAGNGGNSSGSDYRATDYRDANHGGSWSNDFSFPWQNLSPSGGGRYVGDYRFYSGYGGGVFCDANSEANFIDCNITNNIARGGMSGIGGTRPQGIVLPDPITAYRIPSYGGGIYCAENSNINLIGCTISDNLTPRPDTTYHIDPYLGHGGGIAFENTTNIRFENCTISDNNSAVGGGMFWSGGSPKVLDCNFLDNVAYVGGGIYATESFGQIKGCTLRNNFAGASPNDVDVIAGEGGGIFGSSIDTVIADCFLTNNNASASGGGIYIYGLGDVNTIIRNCLLTNNLAGRDGGGISTNWGAIVFVDNCTLYNNQATGAFGVEGITGYGGGLSSAYEGYVDVLNSIIWDNIAPQGSQIAVDSLSFVKVRYSDVNRPVIAEGAPIDPNGLPVMRAGFDSNSLAANDDLSTGLVNIGFAINFFGNQYSSLYVNNNGNVTFDANMATFTPFGLTSNIGTSIIAPFFADVDTRVGNLTTYGPNTIDGRAAFGVTWNNVGYFASHTDKLNTFQMLLIDRSDREAGDFDIEFNYQRILWETGDASGGTNGFGGSSAHAGFSNGTGVAGTFYEFAGSGVPGALLDNNPVTGLINHSRRSTVHGRYIFEVHGGQPALLNAEPFYADNNSIDGFVWRADSNSWEPNSGSHNINIDPCFVFAGEYYLSQIAAGQGVNSPCVDTGSADVNNPDINLGGYTTRTDSVADVHTVDMGYHYSAFMPTQYYLDFAAVEGNGLGASNISPGSGYFTWYKTIPLHVTIPVPPGSQVLWTGTDNDNISGVNNSVRMTGDRIVRVAFGRNTYNLTVQVVGSGGTVTPTSGTYSRGAVVTLTATPDPGYRIDNWQGTDNDSSYARINTVTMNGDKIVRVTFSLPQTVTVPGDFTTIQAAIEAARPGDIVSVASGIYHDSTIVLNKEITLASTNPDDPCVVAATIIDLSYGEHRVHFGAGAGPGTIFDGFTITSGSYSAQGRPDGAIGQNGLDGYGLTGGAMVVEAGARPTIRNCVVKDTTITGGNASNGGGSDAANNAGRGGWAGWARGGGIYIAPFANPTLINCTITNCTVVGGNGGNGGSYTAGGGNAGYGGNWSDGTLWRIWGYENDYRWYSGYGGGVFCDTNSAAIFTDCNITNNTARGGMSGTGGAGPGGGNIDPGTSYRIPSYGGGVYCGENANINFRNCIIMGNIAPKPDTTYHTDPYLGYGGGIAFENTTNIRFENCTITGNTSAVGGGMFWAGGSPEVLDCNIINNIAYVGGGIYATGSSGQIMDCSLRGNFAGVSPNDVDIVAGQGGAIFGSSMNADIIDCVLTNNISSTSGAGIHIYGPASAETIIRNCLLTNNTAGRDGAGISVNWGAIAVVENCTLYNNQATGLYGVPGDTGFGGGLYCSYDATTDINNSIFWDNNSLFGPEIYVGTDTNHEPTCGNVTVTFSDIQGGQTGVYVGDIGYSCPFTWGAGNINIDPQFVNALGDDFHLKSIAAGQDVNSHCIDAGGNPAKLHGLDRYSTSTLGTPDMGVVDLGYHYPIASYCRQWDLFIDNTVNFRDLAILASSWIGGVGSETSGYDVTDLADFTDCWLAEMPSDVTPPTPNPMTWAIPPRVLTGSSAEMKATLAYDASGAVYYQFEDVNGTPTGWQVDPCYIATGLSPTGEHCFRVRARDKYNNVTAWSDYNDSTGLGCVSNVGDRIAPSPAPVMIVLPVPSGDRDTNDSSEQFRWSGGELDWWHKIVVDVSGITDDNTPRDELEVRFICSDSDFSSDHVIPATYRPIRIGHPLSIGGRIEDGVGVKQGSYRLTWDTANPNRIVFDVFVNSYGGGVGVYLHWHVCVYDGSGNSVCSDAVLIPQL